MEGEEVLVLPIFPEELVERILGMVPSSYIFKAWVLSKLWLVRLSAVSSHDDNKDKNNLATSLQRRMGEYWTANWTTFCPVLIAREGEDVTAYDRASQRWRRLPSLSFLPLHHREAMPSIKFKGAYLFIEQYERPYLLVANLLTRTWKELPPRPCPWLEDFWDGEVKERPSYQVTLVTHKEKYKVVDLYKNDFGICCAYIYDSKVGIHFCSKFQMVWSFKPIEGSKSFEIWNKSVYLDGALYWLAGDLEETRRGLLVFKVEEETFWICRTQIYRPTMITI